MCSFFFLYFHPAEKSPCGRNLKYYVQGLIETDNNLHFTVKKYYPAFYASVVFQICKSYTIKSQTLKTPFILRYICKIKAMCGCYLLIWMYLYPMHLQLGYTFWSHWMVHTCSICRLHPILGTTMPYMYQNRGCNFWGPCDYDELTCIMIQGIWQMVDHCHFFSAPAVSSRRDSVPLFLPFFSYKLNGLA